MEFFGVVVIAVVFGLVQFAIKQSGKETEDDSFSGDSRRRSPRSSRSRPRPQTAPPTTLDEALQLAEDRDPLPEMRYAGLDDTATEERPEKTLDATADEHEAARDVGDEAAQEAATGSAAGPGDGAVPAAPAISAAPTSTTPLSPAPTAPSLQRATGPLGEALETSAPVYTPTSVYSGYTPTSVYTSGSVRLVDAGEDADEADAASSAEENRD
jgi:hypothetical protein